MVCFITNKLCNFFLTFIHNPYQHEKKSMIAFTKKVLLKNITSFILNQLIFF